MKQTITRKDGITYERNTKEFKENSYLNVRISNELLNKIKEKAEKENIVCSKLVRNIIEEYLKEA